MSDLTARLRGRIGPLLHQHDNGIGLTHDAATRIERLENALMLFAQAYERGGKKDVWAAAYLNNSAWKVAYDAVHDNQNQS